MRPSKTFLRVSLGLVTLVVTSLGSRGDELPSKLVEELGADAYPERVAAEEKLRTWVVGGGAEAKASLLEVYKNSNNPEIRRRALSVLKAVVIEELTDQRPGFVGISMAGVKLPPEVDEGGFGVEIQAVNPGTPAEKADLQVTDVILKLDGVGWSKPDAQNEFASRIGAKRGGDKVKLEVLRGGKVLDIDLVLASRPWSAGTYNQALQLRGADPFVVPSRWPLDERSAQEEAFQGWLDEQKAVTPAR